MSAQSYPPACFGLSSGDLEQPFKKETALSSLGELALVFETLWLLSHHLPNWHLFYNVVLIYMCACQGYKRYYAFLCPFIQQRFYSSKPCAKRWAGSWGSHGDQVMKSIGQAPGLRVSRLRKEADK